MDPELVKEAKKVAGLRDISLAEYFSKALWPVVRKDLARDIAREGKRLSGED
jgi:hypothetical protein